MSNYASGPLAAVNDRVALNVQGDNSAALHIKGGAVAASGMTILLEASLDSTDGVDGQWFGIMGARTNGNAVDGNLSNYGLGAGASGQAYRLNVNNYTFIRVRLSARTAGDVVATLRSDPAVLEPAPGVAAHAVTSMPGTGTSHNVVSAASTNLANLVATGCNLTEVSAFNPGAATAYVKLYNKATAPTAADVPVVTIPVPAGSMANIEFGVVGKRFGSGLGIAVTGGAPANDATAAVAGVQVNLTRV